MLKKIFTLRNLANLLLVGCFLTIWAACWWVNKESDILRYLIQAMLFGWVGGILRAIY